jgi:hypothetical protein
MNNRSLILSPSDFEEELIFEARRPPKGRGPVRPPARRPLPRLRPKPLSRSGASVDVTVNQPASPSAPAPANGTVSRPCPQPAGTATDRCSSPRPCLAIPDLRCVTRVAGLPFHYVEAVNRDAATGLRRVTRRQEGRTQRLVPRAITALEAFVRNARAFGLSIDTILTLGSLYCRCVRGSNPPALSNHSFGDAIDIAGVRWEAARGPASRARETIVHNFDDREQRALLRRLNACLRLSFATVIDYHRNDHRDHFHCDTNQGRGRMTQGAATLRFVQEALGAVLGRTLTITGRLDEATRKALLDYSKRGSEIFRSNRLLDQVFDQLFREVAAGRGNRKEAGSASELSGRQPDEESELETPGQTGSAALSSKDYLAWAQRSLNRILGSRLATDGSDSVPYRSLVRQFQEKHRLPVTGLVNSPTQDEIIKANERIRDYMAWVHRALESDSVFADPPLKSPGSGGSFKSTGLRLGIKAFQGRHGLEKDGFVGAKAESTLIRLCRCRPLGHVDPSPPKLEINWIEIVEGMPLAGLTDNPKERERLDCLKKFLLRALRGNPVDDRYKKVTDVGTHRFVEDFKRRCGTKRGVALARCFKSLHNGVLAPINHVLGEILRWRGDVTDGCICSKMQECGAGRFFLGKARQESPESVYTCFRNVIEPGFQLCRQPCPPCR